MYKKVVHDLNFNKSFRFTIFHKLILFVLLIVVIFCGISEYFNYLSEENTRNQVIQSSLVKAESILVSFESDIDRLINMSNQFVNDEGLLMLSTAANSMDHYDEQVSINELEKRLYFLMCASNYVDDVKVQIPDINRVISVNSSINVLSKSDFQQMSSFKSANGNMFLPVADKLYLNMPYPLIFNKDILPYYNLSISISKKYIKNSMIQLFPNNNEECILIGKNENWSISTNDSNTSVILSQLKATGINVFSYQQWIKKLKIDNTDYWVMGHYSTELGIEVVVVLKEDIIFSQLVKYQHWYIYLAVISILLLMSYAFWANRRIGNPMKRLVYAFKRVETGELTYTISHSSNDEFAFIYSQFNTMMKKIENLISQVYEQRIMMQQAEMKQLQYQINPHFLYNSLYLIHNMASIQDHESVVRLSEHLGGYYKYITRKSADTVPFQEEIMHMMDYIEVQSIRFGDRIKVEIDEVPENCKRILVPTLFLQPIVENAYGHGLEKNKDNGIIRISFFWNERGLTINIEDNGEGINGEKIILLQQQLKETGNVQSVTGLLNVHRRLSILYGGDYDITLSQSELGGLCVTIRISTDWGISNV